MWTTVELRYPTAKSLTKISVSISHFSWLNIYLYVEFMLKAFKFMKKWGKKYKNTI